MLLSLRSLVGALVVVSISGPAALAAPREYWAAVKDFRVRKAGQNYIEFKAYSQKHRVSYAFTEVDTPVRYYTCTSAAANGSKNNWNHFFNVPTDEKSVALQLTIAGLTDEQADKLVANRAFNRKPRNWGEFVAVIAEQDKKIPALYYSVVMENGERNRKELGYPAGETDECLYTIKNEMRYQLDKSLTSDEIVPGYVREFSAQVEIEGGAMLPAESELWQLTFNGEKGWVYGPQATEDRGAINTYRFDLVSSNRTYRRLKAYGTRQRVKPLPQLTLYTKVENGEIVIEVTDQNYQAGNTYGEVSVNWNIYQNYNVSDEWKASGVFKMNGSWTKIKTGVTKAKFGKGRTTFGSVFGGAAAVEARSTARVQYSGSAYFNEEASEESGKSGKVALP